MAGGYAAEETYDVFESWTKHYFAEVKKYNQVLVQLKRDALDIDERLMEAQVMLRLHNVLPSLVKNIYDSRAQNQAWGPLFPFITSVNFTAPAFSSPSPVPVPNDEQRPPSSGPIRRRAATPHVRITDYTENDAPRTAPSHMPRPYSPKSPPRPRTPSPPVPSSSSRTLEPRLGLESIDKETRADTLAGIWVAFHGADVTKKELQNKCGTCGRRGHYYNNCQVPHYACTEKACYVADTHDHYTSAPCPIATPYVAAMLQEEDERNKAKWDRD